MTSRDETNISFITIILFIAVIGLQVAFYGGILYLAYLLVKWVITK